MRVYYRGNFKPSHSTENHVAASLESLGHEVVRAQEWSGEDGIRWPEIDPSGCDLFLFTCTWHIELEEGHEALRRLKIPSVAFHLDRYWGLNREPQIDVDPFFRTDYVFTADGGHDEGWKRKGINHYWSPPGVLASECVTGTPNARYRSDVAFVGSYGYHPEWSYRPKLIDWLRKTYRSRFRLWPRGRSIRGAELSNLYASATVVVGDSCLVPDGNRPAVRYWSDRIPETLGRGGFLIHPWVEGIDEHYKDGEHLQMYELGNFAMLRKIIDHYLARPDDARRIALQGQGHVKENHTYAHRMTTLLNVVMK